MKHLIAKITFIFLLSSVAITINAQYNKYKTKIVNSSSYKKPAFEEVSIYRLQLKFKTGSMKNADTDSPVHVKLNEEDRPFFLNLSKNDREKGKIDTYDILSSSISKIKDIQFLTIENDGEDAWNIKEVEIIVNNISIYKKIFSDKGGWIEWGGGKVDKINLTSSKLRSSPNWSYNNITQNIYKAPTIISAEMIEDQMEALTGNSLKSVYGFGWGKKYGKEYVSVKRVNSSTVHVDLDLKNDGGVYFPDIETDVDFDIQFRCVNGKLKASFKNLSIETPNVTKYIVITEDLREAMTGDLSTNYRYDILGLLNIEDFYDFDFNYYSIPQQKTCADNFKIMENGDVLLTNKRDNRNQVVKSKRRGKTRIQ